MIKSSRPFRELDKSQAIHEEHFKIFPIGHLLDIKPFHTLFKSRNRLGEIPRSLLLLEFCDDGLEGALDEEFIASELGEGEFLEVEDDIAFEVGGFLLLFEPEGDEGFIDLVGAPVGGTLEEVVS